MAKVLYTNANLLDGTNPAQPDSSVTVEDGRITAVTGPGASVGGSHEQVIDLQGRTLMPGMVMGHWHGAYANYGADGGSQAFSGVEQAFLSLSNVQLALDCGYTTLISAGTHYNIDVELAQSIEAVPATGPRIISCSRNYMPAQDAASTMANEELCMTSGPDAFSEGARYDLDRGVQIIKIFASGGHGAPEGMQMTAEEIQAVVDTAREYGARVRAHVSGRQQILDCVHAGVAIIDHGDEADDECIEAYLENGTFVLPSAYVLLRAAELGGNTFGFRNDMQDFDQSCALLPRLVDAGVKLVPGDDFGVWQIPHGDYAKELVCYAEHANIEPLELIRWSTCYGGEMTGVGGLGTIETGNHADLLIVNADPSANIDALTRPDNIQAVIKGGDLVSGSLPEPLAAASAG